jgi:hypothetical protein
VQGVEDNLHDVDKVLFVQEVEVGLCFHVGLQLLVQEIVEELLVQGVDDDLH